MRFRSRISIILVLLITGVTGIGTYNAWSQGKYIAILVLVVVLFAFIGTILGIHYTIDEDKLIVKDLFIIKETYELKKLKSITRTYNPVSSPAASLKRIKLDFGCGHPLIISPANQDVFIEEILRINPNVQVEI